jgi:hypothetical protein
MSKALVPQCSFTSLCKRHFQQQSVAATAEAAIGIDLLKLSKFLSLASSMQLGGLAKRIPAKIEDLKRVPEEKPWVLWELQ